MSCITPLPRPASRRALARLSGLRRPRLLVEAARHHAASFRRERDLRRLIGALPPPAEALCRLLAAEEEAEALRRERRAEWSARGHVALLGAALAEAEALRAELPALALARGSAGA